mgnify:CR=1 FL=1
MFRYSVVYILKDKNHALAHCVRLYASQLKLNAFTPHVTIRHSIAFPEAKRLQKLFKHSYKMPDLTLLDSVHVSSTLLFNANGKRVSFYSIEQPVLTNGIRVPGLHLSLAYKVGKAFTVREMDGIRPFKGTLKKGDFEVAVQSCHAKSPRFWRKVL